MRLKNSYRVNLETGCHLCTIKGPKRSSPQISVAGTGVFVHVAAFILFSQTLVPEGRFVLHDPDLCDSLENFAGRACINEAHLRTGTSKENHRDSIKASRSSKSTKKPFGHLNAYLKGEDIINGDV